MYTYEVHRCKFKKPARCCEASTHIHHVTTLIQWKPTNVCQQEEKEDNQQLESSLCNILSGF